MTTDEAVEVLGDLCEHARGPAARRIAVDALDHLSALARRDVPEPFGSREAAEELGVRVSNLRSTAGLPEPVAELAAGPVWTAWQVRDLAAKRRAAARRTTTEETA